MRCVLTAAIVLFVTAARADDPAETKRKVEVALAVAATGSPEKCECAPGKARPWADAALVGLKEGKPVVLFVGIPPRCCGDAIPATLPTAPKDWPRDAQIVVYAPSADRKSWREVGRLPADASRAEIKELVEKAKK